MSVGGRVAPRKVAVIGAGIVGVSCALFLQRDGHDVTILDPAEPGSKTSFGNSGSISMSSVMPTAVPGLLRKVPRMLLDPAGPLSVRWRHLPRLAPWLIAFLRNTTRSRVEANSLAIAALIHGVFDAYDVLIRQARAEDVIRRNGALKVFETDTGFAASRFERDLLDRTGCVYEVLNPDELRQLEPALAPIFRHAIYMPQSGGTTNPGRLVQKFADYFVGRGGRILREAVTGFAFNGGRRVLTDRGNHAADVIVLAAGPWSGRLARQLGAPVRLEAERGYHIMLPPPPKGISRYVRFMERGFVLGPHEEGLRLTTGIEYARVDAPPDYRRIRNMLPLAAEVLPGLRAEEQSIWLGNRPTLPDSVPVIAPSPRFSDVYLAFGHSHLGLTMGPVTGRIVADMVAGRDPGIDMTPYRATR